jgi:hypothetical protein
MSHENEDTKNKKTPFNENMAMIKMKKRGLRIIGL